MKTSTKVLAAAAGTAAFAAPLAVPSSVVILPYLAVTTAVSLMCVVAIRRHRRSHLRPLIFGTGAQVSFTASAWLAAGYLFGYLPESALAGAQALMGTGTLCFVLCFGFGYMQRRPFQYREGSLDFAAAAVVLATLQWELLGGSGEGALRLFEGVIVPVFCVTALIASISLTYRMFRDPAINKRLLRVKFAGVTCLTIGNTGLSAYGYEGAHEIGKVAWPVAFLLLGNLILGLTSMHRDVSGMYRPEPGHTDRLTFLRWLGPALALATNPAILVLLLYRQTLPSVPLAACSVGLTGVVIWRIHRLLAEREDARRLSELGEKRLQSLVEHAADVIAVTDAAGTVTYISPGVEELLGIDVDGALGRSIDSFVAPSARADVREIFAAQGVHHSGYDLPLAPADGSRRWATMRATDRRTDPSVQGWVWNIHDITDRKLSEEALSQLALYDTLTGLPNRTQMRDHLDGYLRDRDTAGTVAVLFCDLDGFKQVNDVLGHDAGDEVLRMVAGRWSQQLRADDTLGRWGGDEFLVLCPAVPGVEAAREVADRLTAALTAPLQLAKGPAQIGCSIGIVMGEPGEGLEELLRRADSAMYVAKRGQLTTYVG